MRMTREEHAICEQYRARDEKGHVHCNECPLRIHPEWGYQSVGWCMATCTVQEWKEWKDCEKDNARET